MASVNQSDGQSMTQWWRCVLWVGGNCWTNIVVCHVVSVIRKCIVCQIGFVCWVLVRESILCL